MKLKYQEEILKFSKRYKPINHYISENYASQRGYSQLYNQYLDYNPQKQIVRQNTISQTEQSQNSEQNNQQVTQQNNIDIQQPINIDLAVVNNENGFNLSYYTDLAIAFLRIDQRQQIWNYINNLLTKKNLIRSNNINEELLNDLEEPLIQFQPLLNLCIKQLTYTYSVQKEDATIINQKIKEKEILKLYNEHKNDFYVQEQFQSPRRYKKIAKSKQNKTIKQIITYDLRKIRIINYLKIYNFLTSQVMIEGKKYKFNSKLSNASNDYLAFQNKLQEFYLFFRNFQKKKKSKKYLKTYFKRYPLKELIEEIYSKQSTILLFKNNFKDVKEYFKDIVLEPKIYTKKILNLFVIIDTIMTLFQMKQLEIKFQKVLNQQAKIASKSKN